MPRREPRAVRHQCSRPHRFRLPVVPANMKTVVDESITELLAREGYFYVMHRFDLDSLVYARAMRDKGLLVSLSVGVKPADHELVTRLATEGVGADYLTIDIAHGHAESVQRMIAHIKDKLPSTFVIAGNVGPRGRDRPENWGADATKVGVGPGKVCITRLKTGFGTGGWQLSALKWCARVATKPIVADGGIRHHGDIAKSIRFGASMVMIGSPSPATRSPRPERRGRWQALQGVLRLCLRLQQGRVPPRRRETHPGAHQGSRCQTRCGRWRRICRAPSPTRVGRSW